LFDGAVSVVGILWQWKQCMLILHRLSSHLNSISSCAFVNVNANNRRLRMFFLKFLYYCRLTF